MSIGGSCGLGVISLFRGHDDLLGEMELNLVRSQRRLYSRPAIIRSLLLPYTLGVTEDDDGGHKSCRPRILADLNLDDVERDNIIDDRQMTSSRPKARSVLSLACPVPESEAISSPVF